MFGRHSNTWVSVSLTSSRAASSADARHSKAQNSVRSPICGFKRKVPSTGHATAFSRRTGKFWGAVRSWKRWGSSPQMSRGCWGPYQDQGPADGTEEGRGACWAERLFKKEKSISKGSEEFKKGAPRHSQKCVLKEEKEQHPRAAQRELWSHLLREDVNPLTNGIVEGWWCSNQTEVPEHGQEIQRKKATDSLLE